jgi:shikimate dehydrogenase
VSRRLIFIGVTTGASSIMRIFPRWREVLGLGPDVEIAGHDIPVGAPPQRYRAAVAALRDDAAALGALVTTHKIGVYQTAADLFEGLDELAELCGEVSCIAQRDGRLLGWAKDPIAAGRTLERMLDERHFHEGGGHALCMGAGGSGTAIAIELAARRRGGDRPARLVMTDRSSERLARLQAILRRIDSPVTVKLVQAEQPDVHDRLLEELPPHSLVINATGMGKDRPGSPLSPGARFPDRAVVWELNYRGELGFLRQAREQAGARRLTIEDGWTYFIHGWTSVIEEVFQRSISTAELELLAREAAFARPGGKKP